MDKKATNPKDGQATTRADLSNFPDSAVLYGSLAFTEGGLKYGEYNWRKTGVQSSVYVSAARRHLAKWFNGEELDPKTGVHHLGNALACIAVLVDAIEVGNLNDDRPPKVSSDMFNRAEETIRHLQEMYPNKQPRIRADVESRLETE
jgi:Domain of unknown function (DUF5664)